MISLLAILLYLQLIVGGGTYSDRYINQLQYDNQQQITQIQSDQNWNQQVQTDFDKPAGTIVILPENTE